VGGPPPIGVPGPEQRIGTSARPSRCEQAATITVRARQAWSEVRSAATPKDCSLLIVEDDRGRMLLVDPLKACLYSVDSRKQ
jgi:hypothetical protein